MIVRIIILYFIKRCNLEGEPDKVGFFDYD